MVKLRCEVCFLVVESVLNSKITRKLKMKKKMDNNSSDDLDQNLKKEESVEEKIEQEQDSDDAQKSEGSFADYKKIIAEAARKVVGAEDSSKDQLIRLNADFQNFKKRISKERADWSHFAQAQILDSLLPIFDDLDRAIEHSKSSELSKTTDWLDGFVLIQKKWKGLFKEIGIEEISDCTEFDPELHEALMQMDDPDKKTGQIVQLLSKGYKLKGRVLKHAKVSVAK
jgi:molecular chaperone GrpE